MSKLQTTAQIEIMQRFQNYRQIDCSVRALLYEIDWRFRKDQNQVWKRRLMIQ